MDRRRARFTLVIALVLATFVFGVAGFALARAGGRGSRVVCLDPGHSVGGPASLIDRATGLDVADGAGEAGEINANWTLALAVRARLERDGVEVRLTKKSATSPTDLRKRADAGNACALMVRLHTDTALNAVFYPGVGRFKAHGVRTVFVDPAVARKSLALALAMFPYLRNVGVDRVMEEMGGNTDNTGTAYVVSALARVPVVLIENDPAVVRTPAGRAEVADAVARGIEAYLKSN